MMFSIRLGLFLSFSFLTALALAVPGANAAGPDDLPAYAPHERVSGLLRSWGNEEMAGVLKLWQDGFRHYHPGIRYFDTLKGSETAQAALYTSVADLGLMGRKILPLEVYPLFRRKHYFPTEIEVGTGSANDRTHTFALAVFVNRDNPISKLNFRQLDGIFAAQRNGFIDKSLVWHDEADHGPSDNIRTWGQAGLTGAWADQPIHPYGYPSTTWAESDGCAGAAVFFKEAVFRGGDKWNPELAEYEKGGQIAEALAKDRYGIGYTSMAFANPSVKAVALAADGQDYTECSKSNVANRKYPLARPIYIYVDRNPDGSSDPKMAEFLRYVLSREGQSAVARDGIYLPLPAAVARAQLKKLE